MMVQSYPYARAPRYSRPSRRKEFFSQRPISKDTFKYIFEYAGLQMLTCSP